MSALVEIKDVCKIYNPGENEVRALDHVSLTIDEQEFVAIIGHSGSGKSTLMNMLGCLDVPTSGEYWLHGQDVSALSDDELSDIRNREIGFIFQGFNLIPNLTALENVELPLIYRGVSKSVREELSVEALKKVGLEHRMEHKPSEMSGGQQQRVAIARTLAPKPRVLFMDEPLSNLDAKLRGEMRTELKRLHVDTNSTFIYVTHDQLEAMTLSTKVCLMEAGKLRQFAPPLEIYQRPENIFVADFMGNPTMNFLDAEMTQCEQNTAKLSFCGIQAKYTAEAPLPTVKDVVIGIRPEHIGILEDGQVKASIYTTLPTGMETTVKVMLGGQVLSAVVFGGVDYAVDQQIAISFLDSQILLFDKATGDRIAVGRLEIL